MSARHRRQIPLGEHAFWTIVIAVALMTAGLIVWFLAQADAEPALRSAPTPAPCAWDDQLQDTLTRLGEDPKDWTVTNIKGGYAGWTDLDMLRVHLDRDDPCTWLPSVVTHEWMHLQQGRMFGGKQATYAAYGGAARLELVADCGSMLLGSEHTPYIDKTAGGCSASDLAAARDLIEFRPGDTPSTKVATP